MDSMGDKIMQTIWVLVLLNVLCWGGGTLGLVRVRRAALKKYGLR
jgi:hypothetical protein